MWGLWGRRHNLDGVLSALRMYIYLILERVVSLKRENELTKRSNTIDTPEERTDPKTRSRCSPLAHSFDVGWCHAACTAVVPIS